VVMVVCLVAVVNQNVFQMLLQDKLLNLLVVKEEQQEHRRTRPLVHKMVSPVLSTVRVLEHKEPLVSS